jgi:type 1 fimbriae regulatory protein FimE
MTLHLVHDGFTAESSAPPPPKTPGRSPRRTNAECRPREYLTPAEVQQLADAARKTGRYGFRDSVLILTIYRHGLRASEAVQLEWTHFHFDRMNSVHVKRSKNGIPSQHPLGADEVRQLRKLQRDNPERRWVFTSERGGPLSTRSIHSIVQHAGHKAGFAFEVHPHMLRHARGFKLANEGRDTRSIQLFLGHRRIESTTVYMSLDAARFDGFTSD